MPPEVNSAGENSEGLIPLTATSLPIDEEAPEVSPFSISFIKYKPKECQIDGMTSKNAQAALHILRDVGVHFTSENSYLSNTKRTEIKPVFRDGNYKDLYKGLYEDEEIKEIKFIHEKKEQDIRVFFNSLEKEKMFYVIAIKEDHVDTSKGDYTRRRR